MMRRYDERCIETTRAVATWLSDWLGITQKRIELFFVIAGSISGFAIVPLSPFAKAHHAGYFVDATSALLCVYSLWITHRMPTALRACRAVDASFALRLFWQLFVLLNIAHLASGRSAYYCAVLARDVAILAMLYLTCSNADGERGRKAKMAWSKIKELFGTAWVPRPVGAN